MRMRSLMWVLVLLLLFPMAAAAQDGAPLKVQGGDVDVTSAGKAYHSYLAAPVGGGPYPGLVLIHSFNGLEEGYRTLADQAAAKGFVVLAVGWQTFEKSPTDKTVGQLVQDGVAVLKARPDVDAARLGLTGFCAGGRYTMLLLPQLKDFHAGVAWYGFPYTGDTQPASLIGDLSTPLLMIHGSADKASPIANIFRYATALNDAGKYFELKVYYGEPHGFMIDNGKLRTDSLGQDALEQMVSFFQRKLS
jgi:carboxymethylenebutenolidase